MSTTPYTNVCILAYRHSPRDYNICIICLETQPKRLQKHKYMYYLLTDTAQETTQIVLFAYGESPRDYRTQLLAYGTAHVAAWAVLRISKVCTFWRKLQHCILQWSTAVQSTCRDWLWSRSYRSLLMWHNSVINIIYCQRMVSPLKMLPSGINT